MIAERQGRGADLGCRDAAAHATRGSRWSGRLRARASQCFAVPGASALLSALAVAGLPTDAFGFVGFLPPKAEARANAIAALRDRRDTLVFYESPRRLGDTLAAMEDGLRHDRRQRWRWN